MCINGETENLHVLSVPLYEKHTGQTSLAIFNIVAAMLDVSCPFWKGKIALFIDGRCKKYDWEDCGRCQQASGGGIVWVCPHLVRSTRAILYNTEMCTEGIQ